METNGKITEEGLREGYLKFRRPYYRFTNHIKDMEISRLIDRLEHAPFKMQRLYIDIISRYLEQNLTYEIEKDHPFRVLQGERRISRLLGALKSIPANHPNLQDMTCYDLLEKHHHPGLIKKHLELQETIKNKQLDQQYSQIKLLLDGDISSSSTQNAAFDIVLTRTQSSETVQQHLYQRNFQELLNSLHKEDKEVIESRIHFFAFQDIKIAALILSQPIMKSMYSHKERQNLYEFWMKASKETLLDHIMAYSSFPLNRFGFIDGGKVKSQLYKDCLMLTQTDPTPERSQWLQSTLNPQIETTLSMGSLSLIKDLLAFNIPSVTKEVFRQLAEISSDPSKKDWLQICDDPGNTLVHLMIDKYSQICRNKSQYTDAELEQMKQNILSMLSDCGPDLYEKARMAGIIPPEPQVQQPTERHLLAELQAYFDKTTIPIQSPGCSDGQSPSILQAYKDKGPMPPRQASSVKDSPTSATPSFEEELREKLKAINQQQRVTPSTRPGSLRGG